MGSTRVVPYTIEVVVDRGVWTPTEWHVRQPVWMRGRGGADGKPTTLNIRRWVAAQERATHPGGVNEHVGPVRILSARIKDQRRGTYVAEWRRDEDPAFVNRTGLSAYAKRSAMVSGLTLADYEAMARQQQKRGPTGTVAMDPRRQTVAMTPGGTIVMNRARRDPSRWGFVARRGSDSKHVYVSREQAEQIAESPAGTREDYLALWLVPPFYMDAGEGEFRSRHGGLPLAWDYLRGKQDLPEDFLNDPNAWLERVKREDFPTYDVRPVAGTKAWSARNRTRFPGGDPHKADLLRALFHQWVRQHKGLDNDVSGAMQRCFDAGCSENEIHRVMDEAAAVTSVERETKYRRKRTNRAGTKRGLARREREEDADRELQRLVQIHARSAVPVLRVGQKIHRGAITVTAVGTHTIQYRTRGGWTGSVQIPWISEGQSLPSHRRALAEYGMTPENV